MPDPTRFLVALTGLPALAYAMTHLLAHMGAGDAARDYPPVDASQRMLRRRSRPPPDL